MPTSKPAEGVTFTKPTTQLDLEARQARERGEVPEGTPEARSFAVEGNVLDAYAGVSPEYMTYPDETSKPMFAEEGAEAEAEARLLKESGLVGDPGVPAEASTGEDTEPPAAPEPPKASKD